MRGSTIFHVLCLSVVLAACSDPDNSVDEMSQTTVVGQVNSAQAVPDLAREGRLAEQIVDAIFDGEVVWLGPQTSKFMSIYMASQTQQTSRAVLILHGRGYHPDWHQVVKPLRVGLTEHGWNTLSVQLPVLKKEAKYYDYVPIFPAAFPRIKTAIDYLKSQGNDTIVIISHSCGVHMAMDWVRQGETEGMDGFISIGAGATDYKQSMRAPLPYEKINVPVMDVYGELDYPAVLRAAPERFAAIQKAGHASSTQVIIEGANHYVEEHDAMLLDEVSGWLNQTFK